MNPLKVLLISILFMPLVLVPLPSGHYTPVAGTSFTYKEQCCVSNGYGNYSNFLEHACINGTETITGVSYPVANMSFGYSCHLVSNNGFNINNQVNGKYNFSLNTFSYLNGTDSQGSPNGQHVWFYINNSLSNGSPFRILYQNMTVVSTNSSFQLGSAGTFVKAIFTEGNGTYARNDSFGKFNASFNCKSYFDPSTGFIEGYTYVEHDSNGAGDGFTFQENLYVTSSTYTLTTIVNPPSAGEPLIDSLFPYMIILIITIAIIAGGFMVFDRNKKLKQHSDGKVNFKPVNVNEQKGPDPEPLNLTASQPAVQQIVVKEIVKVKCQYCGAIIDSTLEKCPNCGAPRT